ncbi:expressed unknown protein [Seminavis robusta]|uniref:Uncharacterized protein n=1 Tax=Seminavis robusta TaxID=568900 RepID=A0A9N8HJ05_9STRA|nr:expressed unknown protein [Seminavis robusta]|eukprot:Sro528_g160770.1 n/a (588) ;mRNA; r:109-1872
MNNQYAFGNGRQNQQNGAPPLNLPHGDPRGGVPPPFGFANGMPWLPPGPFVGGFFPFPVPVPVPVPVPFLSTGMPNGGLIGPQFLQQQQQMGQLNPQQLLRLRNQQQQRHLTQQQQQQQQQPPPPIPSSALLCKECDHPVEMENGEPKKGMYLCKTHREKLETLWRRNGENNRILAPLNVFCVKKVLLDRKARKSLGAKLDQVAYEKATANNSDSITPVSDMIEQKKRFCAQNVSLDHPISSIQFHDNDVLQKMIPGEPDLEFSVLGNTEFALAASKSKDYNNHFRKIAESSRAICMDHEGMVRIAEASNVDFREKIDGNKQPGLLAGSEAHHNVAASQEIQFTKKHRDSIGGMVTIYAVRGESWNFVIVPPGLPAYKDRVDFAKDLGDYEEYVKWKESLGDAESSKERKLVEEYEADLKSMDKNNWYQEGHHRIVVYKLKEGQRLIFDAKGLTYGVIVPGGQACSVLIFHDLLPRKILCSPPEEDPYIIVEKGGAKAMTFAESKSSISGGSTSGGPATKGVHGPSRAQVGQHFISSRSRPKERTCQGARRWASRAQFGEFQVGRHFCCWQEGRRWTSKVQVGQVQL